MTPIHKPKICFLVSFSLKKVLAIKPLIIGTAAFITASTPALTVCAEKENSIKGIAAENKPTMVSIFQRLTIPARSFGLTIKKITIVKLANTTRRLAKASEPNSGTPMR